MDLLKRINKHDAMTEKDLDAHQASSPSPQTSPGQTHANSPVVIEEKATVKEQKSVEVVSKDQVCGYLPTEFLPLTNGLYKVVTV